MARFPEISDTLIGTTMQTLVAIRRRVVNAIEASRESELSSIDIGREGALWLKRSVRTTS